VVNDEEKDHFCRAAALLFGVHGIDKYVFLSEGWSAPVKDKTENPYEKYDSLAEHPERSRIFSISATNRHGSKIRLYTKMKDKTLTPCSPIAESTGLFAELLPVRELTNAEKKVVKKHLESQGINTDRLTKIED